MKTSQGGVVRRTEGKELQAGWYKGVWSRDREDGPELKFVEVITRIVHRRMCKMQERKQC